jgi:hypothetical protein
MSQPTKLSAFVFWAMVLLGGAVLAPCLILPAWLEYEASLDLRALRQQQVERRQAEVEKLRKQREYLETDEAYVLRLARDNLNIEIPGAQQIAVEPSPLVEPGATTAPSGPSSRPADELVPELSALIESLMQRYPLTQVFVHPKTRPPLLFIGGGLILTAIVLLSAPAMRSKRAFDRAYGPTPGVDADGYLSERDWTS